MYKLLLKDLKYRNKFFKNEVKRLVLKSLFYNYNNMNFLLKFQIQLKLCKLSKYNLSRLKNRCIITGRNLSTVKNIKLSRIKFKEFALMGQLLGFKKASW